MKTKPVLLVIAVFLFGMLSGVALSKKKLSGIDADLYTGMGSQEAADALLDAATQLAEDDSWKLLAIARVHYLGGDKAEGTALIEQITSGKPERSDWARIARIYWEAGERDEALAAFEKSLSLDPRNEKVLAEYGAYLNVVGQRERAEELFAQAFELGPKSSYLPTWAAGSYLGQLPRRQ